MKNTCSHLCKGVFLAFFGIASIACVAPSTTKTKGTSTKVADKTDDDKRTVDTSIYTFAFIPKEHKQAYTDGGTYPYEVTETNKAGGDTRDIRYTSSNENIATVNNTGTVTFVTAGTVIITATKDTSGDHEEVSDSYTLYITKKPADKAELVAEIQRAMTAHGDTVDLNYIDTSAITTMIWLFSRHTTNGYGLGAFNGTISKWDVGEVTNMDSMFNGATAFNQDISGWQVGSVTKMVSMFEGATKFNKDISQWWDRLGSVTSMQNMFKGATAFNQDISKWQVRSVTDMQNMFKDATAFNQDISGWNIRKVVNMAGMFQSATAFDRNLDSWGNKLHADIRSFNDLQWIRVTFMFRNSGLKNSLPSWCQSNKNCRDRSL